MNAPPQPSERPPNALRSVVAPLALLHGAVALIARFVLGVRMQNHAGRDWDFFWQTLPLEALRHDLVASLWNLHAQPPGLSLLGALLARLPGDAFLAELQGVYVLLGCATTGMLGGLVLYATGSRRAAWIAGGLFALSPALLLYEAYVLYTLPTTFLATASVACLALHRERGGFGWLLGFVGAVELLVLTRSVYPPLLLVPAVAFAALLATPPRARRVALCIALCLPAFAWTAKNGARFGVWSGSSWAGCNLWKVAATGHSRAELARLARRGVLPPLVASVPVFSPPSAYRAYGFDRVAGAASLDRDDLHNVNIPAICATYGRGAIALIAREPLLYLRNVALGYGRFGIPSSRHAHLAPNAERLQPWESLVADGVLGQGLTRRLVPLLGFDPFGSLLFFAIPVLWLLPATRAVRHCGPRPHAWLVAVRADPVLPWVLWLVAWTVAVGSAFDLGENERFKFAVSPLLWWLAVREVHARLGSLRPASRGVDPGPGEIRPRV